jgi:hypothetical protein
MTTLLGLVLVVAASCLAVLGVQGIGPSTGPLFLFGIEVGITAMVGVRLVRGDLGNRLASRRFRRLSELSQRETGELTRERDRLVRELSQARALLAGLDGAEGDEVVRRLGMDPIGT